ncbi:unnamed protein product [Citrullus colocynthis]|uniref:Uncharacterized protein n=1 Tax=Citrullus colocynthis TaxID=252529 RepID=A0ABP0Y7N4_9ROSI
MGHLKPRIGVQENDRHVEIRREKKTKNEYCRPIRSFLVQRSFSSFNDSRLPLLRLSLGDLRKKRCIE